MQAMFESDLGEEFCGALFGLGAFDAGDVEREEDVLEGGQVGDQVEQLEDKADFLLSKSGEGSGIGEVDALSFEDHFAGAGGEDTPEETDQRRFAAAAIAGDQDEFAASEGDGDVFDGGHAGIAVTEVFGEFYSFENDFHFKVLLGRPRGGRLGGREMLRNFLPSRRRRD